MDAACYRKSQNGLVREESLNRIEIYCDAIYGVEEEISQNVDASIDVMVICDRLSRTVQ
jgi:hypothetical protein